MAFDESSVEITFTAKDENVAAMLQTIAKGFTELDSTQKKVQHSLGASGQVATGVLRKMGEDVLGTFKKMGTAVVGSSKQLLDMADNLTNLEARTGLSTTALQKFGYAGATVGVSMGEIANATTRMQRSITAGTAGTSQALAKLGLTMAELKKQTPEEQLARVLESISKLPDPAQRSAIAIQLLGRTGASLIPLGKDFRTLGDEAERFGVVIDAKAIKAMDDLGDSMGKMDAVFGAVKNNLLGAFLTNPDVKGIIDGITKKVGEFAKSMETMSPAAKTAAGAVVAVGTGFGFMAAHISEIGAVGSTISGMKEAPALLKQIAGGFGSLVKPLEKVGLAMIAVFSVSSWKTGYAAFVAAIRGLPAIAMTASAGMSAAMIGVWAGLAGMALLAGYEAGSLWRKAFSEADNEQFDANMVKNFWSRLGGIGGKSREGASFGNIKYGSMGAPGITHPGAPPRGAAPDGSTADMIGMTAEDTAQQRKLEAALLGVRSARAQATGSIKEQVAVMQEQAKASAQALRDQADIARDAGKTYQEQDLRAEAKAVMDTAAINAAKMLADRTHVVTDSIREQGLALKALQNQNEDAFNKDRLSDYEKEILSINRAIDEQIDALKNQQKVSERQGGVPMDKAITADRIKALEALRATNVATAVADKQTAIFGRTLGQTEAAASKNAETILGMGKSIDYYSNEALEGAMEKERENLLTLEKTSEAYRKSAEAVAFLAAALNRKGVDDATRARHEIEDRAAREELNARGDQWTDKGQLESMMKLVEEYDNLNRRAAAGEVIAGGFAKAQMKLRDAMDALGLSIKDIPGDIRAATDGLDDFGKRAQLVFQILGGLAGALSQTGGSFGQFAGFAAQGISGVGGGLQARDAQRRANITNNVGPVNAAGERTGGMTTGQKVMAGLGGVSAAVSIWQMGSNTRSAGSRTMQGAMMGAQAGAAFGPQGAVIGAFAGALLGFFHGPKWAKTAKIAGQVLGGEVSDELAQAIQQTMDNKGVSATAASLMNLGSAMQEGMGEGRDVRSYEMQVMALMTGIKDKSIPAAEGMRELGAAFGMVAQAAEEANRVGDRTTVNILKQARATNMLTAEMKAYQSAQIGIAIGGLDKMIGTFADAGGRKGGQKQMGGLDVMAGLNVDTLGIAEVERQSQARAKSIGNVFAATFWAAVEAEGLVGAADSTREMFDRLKVQMGQVFSEEQVSTILAPIQRIMNMTAPGKEGEADSPFRSAAIGAQGLAEAMTGIANAGYLTQDMMTDFGNVASTAFAQATAGGATQREAIQAMLPYLQAAVSASREYGYALDDATAAQVAQAEDEGFTFPLAPMEKMVELLEAIATKMGAELPEYARAGSAATTAAVDDVTTGVEETSDAVNEASDSWGVNAEASTSAADKIIGDQSAVLGTVDAVAAQIIADYEAAWGVAATEADIAADQMEAAVEDSATVFDLVVEGADLAVDALKKMAYQAALTGTAVGNIPPPPGGNPPPPPPPDGAQYGAVVPITGTGTMYRVGEGLNPNAEVIAPVGALLREIGAGLAGRGGGGGQTVFSPTINVNGAKLTNDEIAQAILQQLEHNTGAFAARLRSA